MNWNKHKENLAKGETVALRPHGNSMTPLIKSGNLVTISPDISDIQKNDIVFCKVNGHFYIHLVKSIKQDQYQIGNNHGHINGWTKNVFGKVVKVEKS
jgi:phage repressor protein C with HTH and peptisase S24 domain